MLAFTQSWDLPSFAIPRWSVGALNKVVEAKILGIVRKEVHIVEDLLPNIKVEQRV